MDKLRESLKKIGKNKVLTNLFIQFVKEVETKLEHEGSVRDDVTKHLIDSIFEQGDTFIKSTSLGSNFKFPVGVGSKVSREFLLSNPEIPEYAWEPQTTKLLLHLAKNTKNVFVGGAYFGDQVIPIAQMITENGGIVHAFDLNKLQHELLKINTELNDLNNVNAVLAGLWNDSSTHLNLSESDDLAFATPSTDDKESNTVTIDEFVISNKISNVDLIMLDIEGSEYNALLGAKAQLAKPEGKCPNIIFEIHNSYVDWDNGLDKTNITKFLASFGYHMFSVRDFQGNYDLKNKKIELIPLTATYLKGPPHGFNIVALKNTEILTGDQFRYCDNVSPKYLVHKDPALHHPIDGLT